jgi:hypothetical protein
VPLVKARHLKHVPGRKSDAKDCPWLQYVPTWGLLSGSFRPDAEMCAVRAYWRHRAALLEYRAAHIQHRQKALPQMNVQLTQVLTAMTGATGLAMIRALVAGEREPVHLARFQAPRCASSTEDIAKAVTGHAQPEPVCALKQALALYDVYPEPVRECDAEIERRVQAIKPVWPGELPPLNRDNTHRTHHKNAPDDDARGLLYLPDGGGSGRHSWPEGQHGTNHPLGNRPGPAEVAQRQSLLLRAGTGPPPGDLRNAAPPSVSWVCSIGRRAAYAEDDPGIAVRQDLFDNQCLTDAGAVPRAHLHAAPCSSEACHGLGTSGPGAMRRTSAGRGGLSVALLTVSHHPKDFPLGAMCWDGPPRPT